MTTSNLHINGDGKSTVTFVSNGALVTLTSDHPNFKRIVHALAEGNDPTEFIDVFKAVSQVSDRVTISPDETEVFFDGEPIANGVARTIIRYRAEGRDATNLVRFLERVQQNPSRHSREGLWRWVESTDLHVAEDGRIVAWKSVEVAKGGYQDVEVETTNEWAETETVTRSEWVEFDEPVFRSHSSGTAWVNGEKHEGQIPYAVGDVVTMPREEVEDDPSVACHVGLHVGAFSYASSFGGSGSKILEVAVAPEDVVSVPNDSNGEKIRCCRFEVLGVQDRPTPDLGHYEPEATWDDEEAEEEIYEAAEDDVQRTFLGRLWGRLRGESEGSES